VSVGGETKQRFSKPILSKTVEGTYQATQTLIIRIVGIRFTENNDPALF
jgi:hypothetical protein